MFQKEYIIHLMMDNSSESLSEQNTFLMECYNCSRIWDGNAQCPCLLYTEEEDSPSTEDSTATEGDTYMEWLQEVPTNSESIWVHDSRYPEMLHEYDSIGYRADQMSIIDALVFEDEYVLEESETTLTLESEKISQNKKDLQEIVEIIDNYKDSFAGGDHLNLMNIIQKVYSNQ